MVVVSLVFVCFGLVWVFKRTEKKPSSPDPCPSEMISWQIFPADSECNFPRDNERKLIKAKL